MNRSVRAWLWPMSTILLIGVLSLAVILQINAHVSQFTRMSPWLIARASGVTALVLLTILVAMGLVLSSVPNKSNWRQTKWLLPFHRYLSLFLVFFIAVHIVSIVLDPYAKVGWLGALVPGGSAYRSIPVAVGTIALYAIILTIITARFPSILPNNRWLTIHRVALFTFIASWTHGALTGTDTPMIRVIYLATAGVVLLFLIIRYWYAPPVRRTQVGKSGSNA